MSETLASLTGAGALPPYNDQKPCPKCGAWGGRVRTWFCDGRRSMARASSSACYGEAREHLHRKCPQCQYEWLEAPRDAANGR